MQFLQLICQLASNAAKNRIMLDAISCATPVGRLWSHRNGCWFLFVLLLITSTLMYYSVSFGCEPYLSSFSNRNEFTTKTADKKTNALVLFWTPLFQKYERWFTYFSHAFDQPCAKSCSITTDKTRVKEADAVIFSAYAGDQIDPPSYRNPSQLWVMFSRECPSIIQRNKQSYSRWNGLFNWTLTYRLDSDVTIPYGETSKKMKKNHDDLDNFNSPSLVLPNKKKMAAAVISHCETPFDRLAYIEKLRKAGIEVDLYGKCGPFKCPTQERNPTKCFEEISKIYKFVLAFENSICKDYASEKLFEALLHPWVPVVIGGADYGTIAPPKSVIDATSMSPDDLAGILKKLDTDEEEYLKYFAWKSSYKVTRPSPYWACSLCDKLQRWMSSDPGITQTYHDIYDWWVTQAQCHA